MDRYQEGRIAALTSGLGEPCLSNLLQASEYAWQEWSQTEDEYHHGRYDGFQAAWSRLYELRAQSKWQ